ncbi:CsgG/HfaB family protein [Thiohalomonas denitrificans]|uniref:Curli production assembly/transport component CsgG n=1 Tax=Thiohalomonas denitrificans TaxID=415747 RepID=A0A1G5QWJ6_9GAMM|nr:CsgG/HfaB family protein [Thiohalomonas denitrificans]SCZ65930.1 Curli biogenesis system outer membrane secretion channel CsgG [Thiohalomonas denitrificans]
MKLLITLMSMTAALVLSGCGAVSGLTSSQSGVSAEADTTLQDELGPYNGPRPRLAVADFKWKVGQGGRSVSISGLPGTGEGITISEQEHGVMTGLEDMLTTALVQSQRFRVLERSQLKEVQSEQKLAASGQVDAATAAQQGNIAGADILIIAAVTGWEPNTSGGSASGGGGLLGKAGAVFGGLSGAMNKSAMAMDIRLIDANTGEVVAATNIDAEAKDMNLGAALGAIGGGAFGGGALSSYSNTPMEKVIRECIYESTKYVAKSTPKRYFQEN